MTTQLYILRLRSGRLYVGVTTQLEVRWQEHVNGAGCKTTKDDPPAALLYTEDHPDFSTARLREAQIKRWTRAKKEALVAGDLERLHSLAKRGTRKSLVAV